MNTSQPASSRLSSPITRLRRLAPPREVQERCELCGRSIGPQHQHVLDLNSRQLSCACDACAILFSGDQTTRYRRVSHRVELLNDLHMNDAIWDSLHIPINLAFFYRSSQADRGVAMYPSPAGATESTLPIDAWTELEASHPALREMRSDVEALLVNHINARSDCYLVSIDECYKLVGLIRSHSRGLAGGTEVWRAIGTFFNELNASASGTKRKSGGIHGA